jgi:hypothetical protein
MLLAWVLPLSFFGGMFGFASIPRSLARVASPSELVMGVVACIAAGVLIALIVAVLGYFVFSHRSADRRATTLELTVEGPFLRLRQHTAVLSDRKLHFRSIVDYAVNQDWLMRCFGVFSLQMATCAGGTNATLIVPGVKDSLKARDLLADIDRMREGH